MTLSRIPPRRQTATYWPPVADDGLGGRMFDVPVLIVCRWEDRAEAVRNTKGEEVTSKSIVYPDRELAIGGYLALGDASDMPEPAPRELLNPHPIIAVATIPNLRNTATLYKVWL